MTTFILNSITNVCLCIFKITTGLFLQSLASLYICPCCILWKPFEINNLISRTFICFEQFSSFSNNRYHFITLCRLMCLLTKMVPLQILYFLFSQLRGVEWGAGDSRVGWCRDIDDTVLIRQQYIPNRLGMPYVQWYNNFPCKPSAPLKLPSVFVFFF